MHIGELSKIETKSAADVCRLYDLDDKDRGLLDDKMSPARFLAALVDGGRAMGAIRFMAHALPKRQAVWWACVCAREVMDDDAPAEAAAALKAAEDWVYDASEENRRIAESAATADKHSSPAGWAALGAFWCGDSLGPADGQPVPPAENLAGAATNGGVLMAASLKPPEVFKQALNGFLELAVDIANGGTGRIQDKIT